MPPNLSILRLSEILTVNRFRQKFKSFIDQYELRELHFQSLMRTKECEVQYNVARYEQQRKLAENETTRSRTLNAQVSTFSQTETELRSQLNIYVEKFKQVRYCCIFFMLLRSLISTSTGKHANTIAWLIGILLQDPLSFLLCSLSSSHLALISNPVYLSRWKIP